MGNGLNACAKCLLLLVTLRHRGSPQIRVCGLHSKLLDTYLSGASTLRDGCYRSASFVERVNKMFESLKVFEDYMFEIIKLLRHLSLRGFIVTF